jgi:multidrug efflux system membrane fusion protein
VTVSKPIEREVTDYVDFTGRTDAILFTEIRPRVTGYLVGMPFKEGAVVKKDDVLFEIDDRPYKAALDLAKASLDVAKASLVKAQADYDIGLEVKKQSAGAISDQELVKRLGARDEAKGNVERAKASLENAQLNFDWCKVKAPSDGQISRYNYTLGNLVNQDQTVLTTVASQDPMYVYFDVDENTMLDILHKLVLPSKVDVMAEKDAVPVLMGLSDEKGFQHRGFINFSNNIVNPSTGTISLRGVFDNPGNAVGKRLLRPGMFVRVRLPLGKPHKALLVSEKAIGTDQGMKYLFIVDSKKLVQYQRIKPGPQQDDGLRVVDGIKPDDLIITSGLQLVRPQMEVKPEEEPMPTTPAPESAPKSSLPAVIKQDGAEKK